MYEQESMKSSLRSLLVMFVFVIHRFQAKSLLLTWRWSIVGKLMLILMLKCRIPGLNKIFLSTFIIWGPNMRTNTFLLFFSNLVLDASVWICLLTLRIILNIHFCWHYSELMKVKEMTFSPQAKILLKYLKIGVISKSIYLCKNITK